jgi:hypothetical protein
MPASIPDDLSDSHSDDLSDSPSDDLSDSTSDSTSDSHSMRGLLSFYPPRQFKLSLALSARSRHL